MSDTDDEGRDVTTVPAPPPESTRPDTDPPNSEKVDIDEPGLAALANLIDNHLGKFLEKQEQRDEQLRELVVETLNEALINRDQMSQMESANETRDKRLDEHDKELERLRAIVDRLADSGK